jgi:predicted RecA/RadA family phage recombinase
MKTILPLLATIVLLAISTLTLGCGGYGSGSGSGSGAMAAGAPNIAAPLIPNTATAGSAAFTLTVNGGGFVGGSVIYWNTTAHTTQMMASGQLTTSISAAEIAAAGTVPVHVQNPGGTGIYNNQPAQNSNTVNFTVE